MMTGKAESIPVAQPLKYIRIYADSEGDSHIADEEMAFQLMDYAPPADPISASVSFGAWGMTFISSPAGWFGDWHPAPQRQFILVSFGELEIEVSDGETRRLGPGESCLVEDTTGKGHVSRVVSDVRSYAVAIPIVSENG